MLNYKECSIEDFNAAMKEKYSDVSTLSTEYLYILYTKFKADASLCYSTKTTYARDIGNRSEAMQEKYKIELLKRGILR